jgi:hypothetical protein
MPQLVAGCEWIGIHPLSAMAAESVRARRPTSWSPLANADSTELHWPKLAASLQKWTAQRFRTGSISTFMDLSSPMMVAGGRAAEEGVIVNLTEHQAEASRRGQLDLLSNWGPDKIICELAKLEPTAPLLPPA